MTITTRYPTTDIAVTGTWTNPTGVQAAGGTSATITMANKNTTFERQQGGYGFDGVIPAGAVINSVQIEVMHSVSTTSSLAFLENLAYIGTQAGAVNSDNTEPTTLTARTYANYARPGGGSWTRDDLLDGTFKTGLRSREGNSTVSCTFSYDYIRVTVDWSLPALSATASVQLTDLVGASAGTAASASVPAKAAVSWVAFQAPLGEAVGTASPTLEALTRASSGKVRVKGTSSKSLAVLTGIAGSTPPPAQLSGNRKLAEMVTQLTQSPSALARFTPTITGAVYHVAKNGSDSNPGTEAQPFLTINKGWWAVSAGGVCYVHDGVYAERPYCDRSGTSDTSMINVIAYPGDNPVLDASTLGLAGSTAYIIIQGDYTYFSGFEVRNSGGWGIKIYGNHSVVDSCQVHDCQNNGIFISGDYSTAQYNKVWHTCLDNYGGTNTTWASACSAGRGRTGTGTTYYATLRGNEVWENWGEGVSCYESSNTLIENNISHDNFTGNIYISDSAYVTVRQNLVYCLPTSIMYNNSYAANVGIMIGSELHLPDITDITVVNNIVYGCYRNLYWFLNSSHTNDHMNNILIANNTFVNSANEPGFANVHMSNGLVAHVNTAFKNNIVVQDDSVPIIYQPSSITYSGNVYSKTPSILGTGDIVADPKLSRIGSPYLTEYYNILLDSPAIGRASTLTDNTVDYFNFTRSAPYDSGAAEYIRPLPKAQGTVITPQGISGTASATLGSLTRTASGKVFTKASSSVTLGSLGRSAAARVLAKGTATSTLSWMTSTAQAKARANGTSSKTLDAVTRASAAKAYIKGSVAQALEGLARSAAAKVFGKGTASATLSGLTGAGVAKARANATQSKSLAVLTSASAAKLLGKGTSTKTLAAITGTGGAKVQVKGTVAKTLASLSVYSSSSSAHIGTANSTLAGVTATSAVKTPIRATAGKTLGALVSSVVAKLTGKGTASSTLASVGRSAAVKTTISGSGAKALATLTGHASTSAQTTLVTGQASRTLGQLSGTAQTKVQLKATLNKVLASLANTGTIQARAGGSVSSVLAGLARSSTAVAPVRGAVSKAFAALSSAAAGTSKIVGTAASTLGALKSSSSAKPQTSAQASRTFDPLIGTASVKSTIAGKVLRTLGQLTSAAGAKVASVGTANRSLGTLTTSTSGKVRIVGTASRSLGQLVASSGVMSSSKGTASSTLGQLVATATGKARAAATATRTLGQIVTSANAKARAGGSSSKTLAAVSGAAVAQGRAAGVVSRTLAVLTAGAQVVSTISGRAVSTLGQLRSTVSGGVKNEGTASATLGSLRSFAIAGAKGSTSVIAPSAIARASASIPTVSASRNVFITAETARAFATAKVAQVSTSTNVSVETATARATAQISTPVVTTTSNVTVVVPAARATAKAAAASVSTSVTVTTSARATAKAAQPTVTVGVSASINAPSGHAVARTTPPQVTVGVSITVTPQVGRSFAKVGLPLVSTTRNVVVQATAARAWARAAAPRFADFGTPASRVYRLPAGNRVHRLAAMDTTYTIPFEDRVIKVVDEGSG